MTYQIPDHLRIPAERLGEGSGVRVRVLGDMADVARDMAQVMLAAITRAQDEDRSATLIVPVGPVGQYPVLAEMLNAQRVDCRDVMLINMDEYLTDDDRWVAADHPLSFHGFMDRQFYGLIDPALAPRPENRIFPDPAQPERIQEVIDERGGVDVCLGGIGINGHIAFNESLEPEEMVSAEEFAALPTRALSLTRETRAINSEAVAGEISIVPKHAVTVGMNEILASRALRFYCDQPWQSAVVRRVLHGPITPATPASFLRTHPDAQIAVTAYVAALPDIMLR